MDREIILDNHALKITHCNKILFPKTNITKDQLLDYYSKVFKLFLPHLQNRPLTLQRFPNGINEPGFFHKNASSYFPTWIKKIELPKKNGIVRYAVITTLSDILYLVNLNTIAFHVGLSTIKNIYFPDMLVLDLDPYEVEFDSVKRAAIKINQIIESLSLKSFVKTTGSRGLHIHIPLIGCSNFQEVHQFAKRLANYSEVCYPDLLTIHSQKNKRVGRIFVDYLRNSYNQTVVSPYSVRAKEGAPIATPLEWDELDKEVYSSDHFNISNIFDRLNCKGDIWSNLKKYACSFKNADDILKKAFNFTLMLLYYY